MPGPLRSWLRVRGQLRLPLPGYDLLCSLVPVVLSSCASFEDGRGRALVLGYSEAEEVCAFAEGAADWEFEVLEPAEARRQEARRKVSRRDMQDRVRFVAGYTGEGAYDAVVGLLVAHHLPAGRPQQAFMEAVAGVLRPQGLALLADLSEEGGPADTMLLDAHARWAQGEGLSREAAESLRRHLETELVPLSSAALQELASRVGLVRCGEFFRGLGIVGTLLQRS